MFEFANVGVRRSETASVSLSLTTNRITRIAAIASPIDDGDPDTMLAGYNNKYDRDDCEYPITLASHILFSIKGNVISSVN